jgi:hypothetical protein
MKKEINHKEDTGSESTTLTEQNAPEKNTDNAFVKVGRDGQPEMPEQDQRNNDEERGSLTHR